MDLQDFDTASTAEQGAVMTVRHPSEGTPLLDAAGRPVTITLAGADSQAYRKAEKAATNRRLARQGKRNGGKVTAEEIEADTVEILSACTLAWSGITNGGTPVDCTPDNVKAVYRKFHWIREQADEFVQERSHFLKNSPTPQSLTPPQPSAAAAI